MPFGSFERQHVGGSTGLMPLHPEDLGPRPQFAGTPFKRDLFVLCASMG